MIKKMKKLLFVIAIALVAIAANMTYQTLTSSGQQKEPHPFAKEEVVKVMGKYETQFDGFGAETGFLVQTNQGLTVVPFDEGSMAGAMASPEYISVYWPKDAEKPMVTPGALRQ